MFGIEKDFQKLMEQVYGPLGEKKQMTEIEELKAQIKVLEKKLSFLEELEKTKSPVEEAYKEYYGKYPITDDMSGGDMDYVSWNAFQKGYNAAYQEPEENEWKLVALKLGEKLSDNGPGGYYDFTPGEWLEWALNECEREMIKRNLKTSLREMVNGDVRPIDDLIDKMVAELKGETLTDLIWKWWENVFTTHEEWDAENVIEELVNRIELFLPKEQSAAGSQNAYVESAVEGFNDCLNKIKRKLR